MVFYRKYRPQNISELDLLSVREKLTSILLNKEIPHAFIFAGPKGLGKTSAARILAKTINCQENNKKTKEPKTLKLLEPCNKCSACISITNGSNMDVLEIDAASNRGIDEIRDLREKIKFSPASLPKKVYIIDEVHMLTTEAFNALLKTLEEPPKHAMFILCTTESWKIPPTILSRAFFVPFEKPSKEELTRSLDRIVKGENLEIEKGVLEKIYSLSEGSFRDGAKILEELSLSASDKKITNGILNTSYKVASIDKEIYEFLNHLANKKGKEALFIIGELEREGVDFRLVNEKIVNILRRIFLKRSGFENDVEDIKELEKTDLEKLMDEFNKSYKDIRFSVLPQLPLELVVAKWCLDKKEEIAKVKEIKKEENIKEESPKDVENKKEGLVLSAPLKEDKQIGFDDKREDVFMASLIDKLKKENSTVAGVLRSCKLSVFSEDEIGLIAPYKFHGERLRDPKTLKILEDSSEKILGKKVRVSIGIKNDK